MRILIDSYGPKNLFRYRLNCTLLSSFCPQTQKPNTLDTVLPANSLCKITSLCNSSSGPSSFLSSESYPLQKEPFICISSSGLASKYPLNSYLPIKNHCLSNSSSWLSSRFKFETRSSYKCQYMCYFSFVGPYKIRHLAHSYNSRYGCSDLGCLSFAVSFSSGTFVSGPVVESEDQRVGNICSDQQKLEKRNSFPRKFVLEIVDILRSNGKDLESRLHMLATRLSVYSITEIFEVLNSQRIPGLRFFEWIWSNNPQLHKNARVCSLAIDNIGRLEDYESMFTWLKKFKAEKICLTYDAFGFLPVLASSNSSLEESTVRLVDLLNKVGGSCRNSGVCSLVEMFCKLDLFGMAKYVINITESRESYFCVMIREKCKRGLVEDAISIIREMREAHCAPTTTAYNYVLGSLWKNGKMDEASGILDQMKEIGIHPDAITFEIIINFVCRLGKMDDVHQLLDQMVCQGLEPRLSTHACIIKTLFAAEKYEAVYKYVVDSSSIYKTSSNMMYSLMANLYREKGDIMSARNTLLEMMEKSLKPNFSIYIKIVKQLRRTGRGNLSRELESKHSKFVTNSHA